MPILALGNSRARGPFFAPRTFRAMRGFTLLELLVVLSIVGLAMVGVSLALRDSGSAVLEREGERLAALLEAGRARSRASGIAVRWRADAQGFHFDGLPPHTLPARWMDGQIQVQGNARLTLGPEPLIGAQAVQLVHPAWPGRSVRVATDGLRPFSVEAAP